jgi:hypothetical protein
MSEVEAGTPEPEPETPLDPDAPDADEGTEENGDDTEPEE